MSSIRTSSLSLDIAQQFMSSVLQEGGSNTNMFVMLGKTSAWDPDDATPDVPHSNVAQEYDIWRNAFGGKRIVASDMSLVITRVDWTANTVYEAYDDKANDLFGSNSDFYVLTTDMNVYKCLYNANGANSTVKPDSTSTDNIQTTSDGYIWKFMYNLSVADQVRFLTDDWMPVRTLEIDNGSLQWEVQTNAIDGAIEIALVQTSGQNYANLANLVVTVSGDGTGAQCVVNTNTTNAITNAIMSYPGSGYTYASISVSDLGGQGQGVSIKPVIEPKGGHGSNPAKELGAASVMINMRVKGSEEGILPVTNDFRQVSIVRNPWVFGSNTPSANVVINQALSLSVSGVGPDYIMDEQVFQGVSLQSATFKGTVVDWDTGNSILRLVNTEGGNPDTSLLLGNSSGAARFIISVQQPDLQPYTGDVLYIDNIIPIQRSEDQTENFQIVIEF
jgi:hypothetical protein